MKPPKEPRAGTPAPVERRNGQRQPAPPEAQKKVRLLLAEDHPVVRKGLIAFLAHLPHLEVVGEARDGTEALRQAKELTPDVVLMDMEMPHLDGLAVAEALRKELPHVKVLLLSTHPGARYVQRIVRSGARGYVLKDASAQDLVKAIETVAAGETYFGADFARLALNHLVQNGGAADDKKALSPREREVLVLIADGLYNKEIADRLNIGTRTVETHRESLMRKLNIHSTAGLIKFAIAHGLIILPEMPVT
jgi:two-component system nitrate/nitrite response regulator NarL